MKIYILYLLFSLLTITLVSADEVAKIHIDASCADSKIKQIDIKISSNVLNLSEDALQDNTGGYVDIPEDGYYLKTDDNLFHMKGVVKNNYEEV